MDSLLNAGKILAIELFFGMTFFLAATPKWRVGVKLDVAAINLLYFVGALLSFRETVRAEPVEVRTWRFR
jgi:hypothetical protein